MICMGSQPIQRKEVISIARPLHLGLIFMERRLMAFQVSSGLPATLSRVS